MLNGSTGQVKKLAIDHGMAASAMGGTRTLLGSMKTNRY